MSGRDVPSSGVPYSALYTPLGVGQYFDHPVAVFRIPHTADTIQLSTRTLSISKLPPAR